MNDFDCPVCGRKLKQFFWKEQEQKGMIVEWINQCVPCNYMYHYYHGNLNLSVGAWKGSINVITIKKGFNVYVNKEKSNKIYNNFYKEIEREKAKIKC